ncbi:MAG TPA: YceI family protein [Pseudomonas sabulinigri]|uniref:Lipid/polyisoprenoid-binding YceI-like domain-containing protein n=1 Tax=marine sediment metagenome TaxID=412755 RepID=A0A0F9W762_9ZZZZ|nr:YceI family protein [Halopseudomonas sabulinigri]HEC51879.1 YceI family protein [Halopseudomonas sabulinigri]|tara:strand:+ start:2268 stop:2843 length:576 start_codon:yes stop_codon:yes gene_type:complete
MKKTFAGLALGGLMALSGSLQAADYVIDQQGQHASVNFKISHLGYSWIYGRFNDFSGNFSWDADKPEASAVKVSINTTSVDSNHAERDKHLRSDDFLNVGAHPTATFESTKVEMTGDDTANITGNLMLNGVTKPVVLDAKFIGEGEDPWGGYRAGFSGTTTLALKDFDISMDLGPASQEVELIITVEGVRQ